MGQSESPSIRRVDGARNGACTCLGIRGNRNGGKIRSRYFSGAAGICAGVAYDSEEKWENSPFSNNVWLEFGRHRQCPLGDRANGRTNNELAARPANQIRGS